MTPDEVRAYRIADNKTAELSDWDWDILTAEMLGMKPSMEQDDWEALGFDSQSLGRLLTGEPIDGLTDPNNVPAPPDEATTRPGDLYILGNHRLFCGDSGNAADVDRLLAGQPIHLVNTDPPYNVKTQPRSNNAKAAGLSSFTGGGLKHKTSEQILAKDRPLLNDSVSDDEYDKMMHAWFGNIARVLAPGRGFYIWGGYANCGNYQRVFKDCGLHFSQPIIWVKEHPVQTRADFMRNHESCFYGWREGAAHVYLGPNNATDVWSIKKVNTQAMVHLTEKPVELAVRAIQYSSLPGENVLDLFGGSGSTLIAAEQTGRRAFLMEIDPLYCDVIVKRWEGFTGRRAETEQQ
jgi:DNA modification methylase